MTVHAFEWSPAGALRILDQSLLPAEERWLEIADVEGLIEAIRSLRIRGAPAIGIAAAMGLVGVLGSEAGRERERGWFLEVMRRHADRIAAARPTAVNLAWAMERMRRRAHATPGDARAILEALRAEAQAIWAEDRAMCLAIAEHGQRLLVSRSEPASSGPRLAARGCSILTHCNTGALATGGIGTALGIVHLAAERGVRLHVYVDETRPLFQGSRLTAWELARAGVPHTVLPDAAAGALMATGEVDLVLVGADRVARNGDFANKVGTYTLAVLARHHGIPFYSVAPSSSFDPSCATGAEITIEQRAPEEITRPLGVQAAPEGSEALNPAFDVTPGELVTGYVTEQGIVGPPF